jgi:3-oxoacyl-[acyl-carrier protein] reductase
LLDPKLREKVVLVTGTNNPHGVGAAVAQAFGAQGAKVFLHYFRWAPGSGADSQSKVDSSPGESFYYSQQTKSIDEVLERVRECGAQVATLEADLADASVVKTLFDRAEEALGPVEVLVNNAAHWEGDTFLPSYRELANKLVEFWTDRPQSLNAAAFDRTFAINTRAPVLMMAEFACRHIKRKAHFGRIINVSTAGAERFTAEVTYGASKFALESYTRSAATELGKFGVTVNAVSLEPGADWMDHSRTRTGDPAHDPSWQDRHSRRRGRCHCFSCFGSSPLADGAANLCRRWAWDVKIGTGSLPPRRRCQGASRWRSDECPGRMLCKNQDAKFFFSSRLEWGAAVRRR